MWILLTHLIKPHINKQLINIPTSILRMQKYFLTPMLLFHLKMRIEGLQHKFIKILIEAFDKTIKRRECK